MGPGAEAKASGRPRLLFLAQTLPYPPDGGVKIRTYHVLRQLSRDFSIVALCFSRRGHERDAGTLADRLRALGELAEEVEAFAIPQEHSRARLVSDHLRSVLSGRPYTHYVYGSSGFGRRLSRALADPRRFDVVHVDSLDLCRHLPALPLKRVICAHHNVESALLRRRAGVESSPPRRAYLRHQARLVSRAEARWCQRVALNVTVSAEDRRSLRAICPGTRTVVVPNGVDTRYFRPAPGDGNGGIVFVGGTTWYPNRDALHHFGSTILPLVRARTGNVDVTWVGRALPEEQREAGRLYGIRVTGYVDDVRPIVARAACYVVPLRIGGGTRLKILDAWAMGKAVVSTSMGCEGLEARDGENILIRDTPAGFAAAVQRVLAEPGLRCSLGKAGRQTVETSYDWEVIGRAQARFYRALLRPSRASSEPPETRRIAG